MAIVIHEFCNFFLITQYPAQGQEPTNSERLITLSTSEGPD